MSATIQERRDTAANWTSVNPTLAAGEEGYETDTGKEKRGDGATAWTGLPYLPHGTVTSVNSTSPDSAGNVVISTTGAVTSVAGRTGAVVIAQADVTGLTASLTAKLDATATAANSTKIAGVTLTGTPSTGQVPTATSTTAATWQTPSGGGATLPNLTLPPDHGYLAWNFDPSFMTINPQPPATGRVYLTRIDIRTAITATKLSFYSTSAGTGTSGQCFGGLYSSAGTLLSATPTAHAAFGTPTATTSEVDLTLTTPQALAAGSFVWVALLWNGATPPALATAFNPFGALQQKVAATAAVAGNYGTTQTALPGSLTLASITKDPLIHFWVGIS